MSTLIYGQSSLDKTDTLNVITIHNTEIVAERVTVNMFVLTCNKMRKDLKEILHVLNSWEE